MTPSGVIRAIASELCSIRARNSSSLCISASLDMSLLPSLVPGAPCDGFSLILPFYHLYANQFGMTYRNQARKPPVIGYARTGTAGQHVAFTFPLGEDRWQHHTRPPFLFQTSTLGAMADRAAVAHSTGAACKENPPPSPHDRRVALQQRAYAAAETPRHATQRARQHPHGH